jgi:katanin p60 ATPase-containing subunit A1
MTFELSYLQLKTSNEARLNEEVVEEQRKRNLLVLIKDHLQENGYLDSARMLEKEVGQTLRKFEVCDNIDLTTVLQEYESYYFVKFKKQPKLVKKSSGTKNAQGGGGGTLPLIKSQAHLSKQFSSPFPLPLLAANLSPKDLCYGDSPKDEEAKVKRRRKLIKTAKPVNQ